MYVAGNGDDGAGYTTEYCSRVHTVKEQLMKMQDEIDYYTEMTSHILQTHTDHEMVALDLLPTELKANQSSDIHVSLLHINSLIKQLSTFGRVWDSPPSPSQSTWSSESVAKMKERYCVKVESMTSKGEVPIWWSTGEG